MKKKPIALCLTLLTVAVVCSACNDAELPQTHVQQLNYTESVAPIANPDQGFYTPMYVKLSENGVTYNRSVVTDSTRLYHLRCDISDFSAAVNGQADLPLTSKATDGLNDLLYFLKENDKNAIIRFAYDPSFNGNANKEPTLPIILQHVEQVCAVLDDHENTVTAIETGLIGPWGEMHTSSIANAAHISPIVDGFLTHTANIPILLRTPKMIYDYLGISSDDAANRTIAPSEKAYRLGLYNDGYLGSDSDLGTYTDRQRDVEFLSRRTSHLPFGGEVTVPDSTLHNIETCLPEMNKLHLSYLNSLWDNRVIDKWKKSYYTQECGNDSLYYGKTAYDYIANHMGYRYILKNSVFSYSDKFNELKIELTLQNVGFGNLNKAKHAKLLFINDNGDIAFSQNVDDFTGETTVKYDIALEPESGNYDVYLRLYGEELQNDPLYCLQFANDGSWNSDLKANKIGSLSFSDDTNQL